MFLLFLLHFLSFFLLAPVVIQCKRKKKSKKIVGGYKPSRRLLAKKKSSSTSGTDDQEASGPEGNKKKKKLSCKGQKSLIEVTPLEPGKDEEEEMPRKREETLLEKQAKSIRKLQKDFDSRPFAPTQSFSPAEWKRMDTYRRQNYLDDQSLQKMEHSEKFVVRLLKDYVIVHKIYKEHKCPNPAKVYGAEDRCPVCAAYIHWAGWHYSQGFKDDRYPKGIKENLEEDLNNYGGPVPEFLSRQQQWIEVKKTREQKRLKLDKTQESEKKEEEEESSSEETESTKNSEKSSLKVDKTQESNSNKKKNS